MRQFGEQWQQILHGRLYKRFNQIHVETYMDNKSCLRCSTETTPTYNQFTPILNRPKYEAVEISELVLGNSFSLADYAWKMSKKATPLCDCGASEKFLYITS